MLKLYIGPDVEHEDGTVTVNSHGPFSTITREADHYVCNGSIYSFDVIGEGTDGEDIVEWDGAIPEIPANAETIQAKRNDRNRLLAASDWTQLADATLTDEKKAEWATYRQALRDVPTQDGFPNNITWPDEPS